MPLKVLKRKRGRPKKIRPTPTPAQYKLMAETCVALIVEGGARYLELKFPKGTVFPKDFPKGRARIKTDTYWVHKTTVIRLLDWLHANGHSPWNYKQVVAAKHQAAGRLTKMEQLLLDKIPSFVDNSGFEEGT
jgi:hypothetical protein